MSQIFFAQDTTYSERGLTDYMQQPPLTFDAVELSCDQLYFLADVLNARLPWMLAITPSFPNMEVKEEHDQLQRDQLQKMGVLDRNGQVNSSVKQWISALAGSKSRLELRFIHKQDILRGVIVHSCRSTIVALRNAQLVTISELPIWDAHDLIPSLTAGFIVGIAAAEFTPFSFDTDLGVHADNVLRMGVDISTITDKLKIPSDSVAVISTAWKERGCYVEIVAVSNASTEKRSEVGCTIMESSRGMILMEPVLNIERSSQKKVWSTVCQPATGACIARAVINLLALVGVTDWFANSTSVKYQAP